MRKLDWRAVLIGAVEIAVLLFPAALLNWMLLYRTGFWWLSYILIPLMFGVLALIAAYGGTVKESLIKLGLSIIPSVVILYFTGWQGVGVSLFMSEMMMESAGWEEVTEEAFYHLLMEILILGGKALLALFLFELAGWIVGIILSYKKLPWEKHLKFRTAQEKFIPFVCVLLIASLYVINRAMETAFFDW